MQDHGFRIRLYPRRDSSTSSDQSASDGYVLVQYSVVIRDSTATKLDLVLFLHGDFFEVSIGPF